MLENGVAEEEPNAVFGCHAAAFADAVCLPDLAHRAPLGIDGNGQQSIAEGEDVTVLSPHCAEHGAHVADFGNLHRAVFGSAGAPGRTGVVAEERAFPGQRGKIAAGEERAPIQRLFRLPCPLAAAEPDGLPGGEVAEGELLPAPHTVDEARQDLLPQSGILHLGENAPEVAQKRHVRHWDPRKDLLPACAAGPHTLPGVLAGRHGQGSRTHQTADESAFRVAEPNDVDQTDAGPGVLGHGILIHAGDTPCPGSLEYGRQTPLRPPEEKRVVRLCDDVVSPEHDLLLDRIELAGVGRGVLLPPGVDGSAHHDDLRRQSHQVRRPELRRPIQDTGIIVCQRKVDCALHHGGGAHAEKGIQDTQTVLRKGPVDRADLVRNRRLRVIAVPVILRLAENGAGTDHLQRIQRIEPVRCAAHEIELGVRIPCMDQRICIHLLLLLP